MKIFDIKSNKEVFLSHDDKSIDNVYGKYENFKDAPLSTQMFNNLLGLISPEFNRVVGNTVYNLQGMNIIDNEDGTPNNIIMVSKQLQVLNNSTSLPEYITDVRVEFKYSESTGNTVILRYSNNTEDVEMSHTYTDITFESLNNINCGSVKIKQFVLHTVQLQIIYVLSYTTYYNGVNYINMLFYTLVGDNKQFLYYKKIRAYNHTLTISPSELVYLNMYDYWIYNDLAVMNIFIIPKCNIGNEFNAYYAINLTFTNVDNGTSMAPVYTTSSLSKVVTVPNNIILDDITIHSPLCDEMGGFGLVAGGYDEDPIQFMAYTPSNNNGDKYAVVSASYISSNSITVSPSYRRIYIVKLRPNNLRPLLDIVDINADTPFIQLHSITNSHQENIGYTQNVYKIGNNFNILFHNGITITLIKLIKQSGLPTTYTEHIYTDSSVSLTPITHKYDNLYQIADMLFNPSINDTNFKTSSTWKSTDNKFELIKRTYSYSGTSIPYLEIQQNNVAIVYVYISDSYVTSKATDTSYSWPTSIYSFLNNRSIINNSSIHSIELPVRTMPFKHFFKKLNNSVSRYYNITQETQTENKIGVADPYYTAPYSSQDSVISRKIKFIRIDSAEITLGYNTTHASYADMIKSIGINGMSTSIYFNEVMTKDTPQKYRINRDSGDGTYPSMIESKLTTKILNNYYIKPIYFNNTLIVCENNIHHVYDIETSIEYLYSFIVQYNQCDNQVSIYPTQQSLKINTFSDYNIIITGSLFHELSTNKNIKTIYTKDGITYISETPLELNNNTYNSVDADVIHYASVQIEGKTVVFFGSKHDSI